MGVSLSILTADIETVRNVINEMKPQIHQHGGDIEFVSFHEGIVRIRLTGACVGCPMSAYTVKLGVESILKEKLSCVKEVVSEE